MKQRVVWFAVLLVAVLGVPFSVWAATPRQTPTKAPLAVQATVRVVESVPVVAPAVAVTATAVTCDPLTTRSLYGWFTSNTTGSVYNSSYTCAFEVGIAAYSMFDDRIGNQQLFDYTMYTVAPRQTINLNVKIPDCKAQLDIFRGPVLHSLVGQRYGERLLSTRFPNTTLCAPPVEEVCSQGQISRLSGVSNNQLVTGVLNIQAEVTGALPQKVEFALTGAQTTNYTDVNSPYYFMGNNGSQPNGWDSSTKPEGDYRLSATYVGLFGESLAIRCEPVAVNFSIRRSTPTTEPTATSTPLPTATNTP
ncbi:MAG TPA: hypothetical protein DEF47_15975, partial [Herpetosiphon sp.]|nr:hypothetical protein [Herpetosiphon sp.]